MTTNIEFDNVNERLLDKILDKPKNQLSQEDLLIIRDELFNTFNHKTGNLTKQELLINHAMYVLTEARYFKPYDQRSLVEFTLSYILNWLDENENSNLAMSPDNIFETYLKNKTLTSNRSETLNYIHAFWNDFIDSVVLDIPVENLFEQPEEFLLSQVCYVSRKLLVPLWERNLSKKECKKILSEMSLYELEKIVYKFI